MSLLMGLLPVAVALLAVVAAAICAEVARAVSVFRRGDLCKLPRPPRGSLLLGHLRDFTRPNFHQVLSRWVQSCGTIYRLRVMGSHIVVVADPAAVGQILGQTKAAAELPKHAETYQVLDLLWSAAGTHSIFTDLSTPMWRTVRKAVSPAFSSANIRAKFPMVLQKATGLADAITARGGEEAIDIDNAGMRLTLDVVGLAGFGHDFGAVSLGHNHVIAHLPPALEMCQRRMTNPISKFIPSREQREGMRHVREFRGAVSAVLAELKARGPPAADDNSIGALLLRAVDPATGEGLSDDQLRAEIGTMIMGGFETTAHTLAFTLFCIATNPAAEAAVVAELQSLGLAPSPDRPQPRDLQHEDLRNMPRVTNAIKEAMRMHPVVAGVPRIADEGACVGGHRIPRGVMVYVLFHALHNSPALWKDPDAFLPDRWEEDGAGLGPLSDGASSPGELYREGSVQTAVYASSTGGRDKTFLPFSDGPRGCVGQAMAMMELKVAVATLFSRFTFELAPDMGGPEGVRASEIMALTLHTRNGIRMHCRQRLA